MVTTTATRPRARRIPAGAATLVMVALIPVAAYILIALRRVGYPYELSYFEGSTVEVTARVTAGLPIYGPPTTDFTPWPYPPMYFWLSAAVSQATGLNITALRLVSLGASLAVLVLIALIVRRVSGSVVAGIVAAGLYAASYRVSGAWADTARVDSLLLAFLLGAVLIGLSARWWAGGVAIAALLFLAFLTKQNALLVAAPVLLWLLIFRRSTGIWATAGLVGAVAASTVVADAATDGWYSASVFGQLIGQPWAPQWLAGFWLVDIALPFGIAIVLGLWLVQRFGLNAMGADATWWRRGGDAAFLAAGGIGLLLAALSGRLHDGGYANVAMPAHAAVAICFGMLLAAVRGRPRFGRRVTLGVTAALVVQFAVMTLWRWDVLPSQADRAAGDAFIAAVRELPGRVLIPSHPYYLRLAGLPTHASDVAIADAGRGEGGRVSEGVQAALPWSLDGVDAVVLDTPGQAALFGGQLTRDFTLVDTSLLPDGTFIQITDLTSRPSLLYVRTGPVPNP